MNLLTKLFTISIVPFRARTSKSAIVSVGMLMSKYRHHTVTSTINGELYHNTMQLVHYVVFLHTGYQENFALQPIRKIERSLLGFDVHVFVCFVPR